MLETPRAPSAASKRPRRILTPREVDPLREAAVSLLSQKSRCSGDLASDDFLMDDARTAAAESRPTDGESQAGAGTPARLVRQASGLRRAASSFEPLLDSTIRAAEEAQAASHGLSEKDAAFPALTKAITLFIFALDAWRDVDPAALESARHVVELRDLMVEYRGFCQRYARSWTVVKWMQESDFHLELTNFEQMFQACYEGLVQDLAYRAMSPPPSPSSTSLLDLSGDELDPSASPGSSSGAPSPLPLSRLRFHSKSYDGVDGESLEPADAVRRLTRAAMTRDAEVMMHFATAFLHDEAVQLHACRLVVDLTTSEGAVRAKLRTARVSRNDAATSASRLASGNLEFRDQLIVHHVVPWLTSVMSSYVLSPTVQHLCCSIVDHLAQDTDQRQHKLLAGGVARRLAAAMCNHRSDPRIQIAAAWALHHLASHSQVARQKLLGADLGLHLEAALSLHRASVPLQIAAWSAGANLVASTGPRADSANLRRLATPTLVGLLLGSMARHLTHAGVQEATCRFLSFAAQGAEKLKIMIFELGVAIPLRNALRTHFTSDAVQLHGARAVTYLSQKAPARFRGDFNKVLAPQLLSAMKARGQKETFWALAALVEGCDEAQDFLWDELYVSDDLTEAMSLHLHAGEVQKEACRLLAYLVLAGKKRGRALLPDPTLWGCIVRVLRMHEGDGEVLKVACAGLRGIAEESPPAKQLLLEQGICAALVSALNFDPNRRPVQLEILRTIIVLIDQSEGLQDGFLSARIAPTLVNMFEHHLDAPAMLKTLGGACRELVAGKQIRKMAFLNARLVDALLAAMAWHPAEAELHLACYATLTALLRELDPSALALLPDECVTQLATLTNAAPRDLRVRSALCDALVALTWQSPEMRARLLHAGAAAALQKMLRVAGEEGEGDLAAAVCRALQNLALGDVVPKRALLVEGNLLKEIMDLMDRLAGHEATMGAVFALLVNVLADDPQVYVAFAAEPLLFPRIGNAMIKHRESESVAAAAAWVVLKLAPGGDEICQLLLNAGAAEQLVEVLLLHADTEHVLLYACGALKNLATAGNAARDTCLAAGALPVLADIHKQNPPPQSLTARRTAPAQQIGQQAAMAIQALLGGGEDWEARLADAVTDDGKEDGVGRMEVGENV